MTKRSAPLQVGRFSAAAAGLAVLLAASAASAQCASCRSSHQPAGLAALIEAFTPSPATDCSRCVPVYQGDYMVSRGPVYSGPALIAPQPTYSPAPTASGYPYVSGYPAEPGTVRRGRKGGPEIIRARAQVTIYGPERMDIHLYREGN